MIYLIQIQGCFRTEKYKIQCFQLIYNLQTHITMKKQNKNVSLEIKIRKQSKVRQNKIAAEVEKLSYGDQKIAIDKSILTLYFQFITYMRQENNRQDKIYAKLKQISNKVSQIIQEFTFEQICKDYNQLSAQFMYLINYLQNTLCLRAPIQSQLQTCVNNILIIVKSLYNEKYGLRLPLFSKIINRCQKLMGKNFYVDHEQKVLTRIQKNQSSLNYKKTSQQLYSTEYDYQEKQKNNKLHNFLHNLSDNQILMTDPICAGCSSVYIKNMQILNKNPQYPNLIGLTSVIGFHQFELQKHVTAILNKGGGIIIIGAEIKVDKIIAIGIKFKDQTQIKEKLTLINQSLMKINPPYTKQVQLVKIRNNYFSNDSPKQQYLRFCVRIIISAKECQKINYLSMEKSHAYEIYTMSSSNNPKKVVFEGAKYNLYNFIHQKYYQFKKIAKKVNSHPNSQCVKPCEDQSNNLTKYIQDGGQLEELKNLPIIKQQIKLPIYDDEPKFKYQFSSLLVLPNKKNRLQKEDFVKALLDKKQLFQLSQPFSHSFKEGGRLIYLLCHKMKHNDMKNFYKDLEKNGIIKNDGSMILMPVHNQLEIERSKLSAQHQKHIKNQIMNRYGIQIETTRHKVSDSENGTIQKLYLNCHGIDKSMFAYRIFQQLKLKPYFVKEIGPSLIKKKNQQKK